MVARIPIVISTPDGVTNLVVGADWPQGPELAAALPVSMPTCVYPDSGAPDGHKRLGGERSVPVKMGLDVVLGARLILKGK